MSVATLDLFFIWDRAYLVPFFPYSSSIAFLASSNALGLFYLNTASILPSSAIARDLDRCRLIFAWNSTSSTVGGGPGSRALNYILSIPGRASFGISGLRTTAAHSAFFLSFSLARSSLTFFAAIAFLALTIAISSFSAFFASYSAVGALGTRGLGTLTARTRGAFATLGATGAFLLNGTGITPLDFPLLAIPSLRNALNVLADGALFAIAFFLGGGRGPSVYNFCSLFRGIACFIGIPCSLIVNGFRYEGPLAPGLGLRLLTRCSYLDKFIFRLRWFGYT